MPAVGEELNLAISDIRMAASSRVVHVTEKGWSERRAVITAIPIPAGNVETVGVLASWAVKYIKGLDALITGSACSYKV